MSNLGQHLRHGHITTEHGPNRSIAALVIGIRRYTSNIAALIRRVREFDSGDVRDFDPGEVPI
ncbi:MAG TPA: hypothetical protein VF210_19440 [Pseudomonadales bacterium]